MLRLLPLCAILSLFFGAFAIIIPPSALPLLLPPATPFEQLPLVRQKDIKVPVAFAVMSRCPDALICEAAFAKAFDQVEDKISLSLAFIAQRNDSEPVFGATCKHGSRECAGNVHELCAAHYLPQRQWWAFVKCLNFEGQDHIGEPDLALKCGAVARFDWVKSGVGRCAGEDASAVAPEGIELLHESMREVERLNATTSCTMFINEQQVCIHDGSWKRCYEGHTPEDFVRQINQAYDELNAGVSP